MSPNDSRHGTNAGYFQGCREECCRTAATRYVKRLRMDRTNGLARTVPAIGTWRRVEALMCLGWSQKVIAERAGLQQPNLSEMLRSRRSVIRRSIADRVATVYDDLSMRLPEGTPHSAGRARALAKRRGYAPPLAWDDGAIDDPNEQPTGHKTCSDPDCASPVRWRGLCKVHYDVDRGAVRESTIGHRHKDLDLIRVYRILDGDYRLSCSELDKAEVCRRWVREGRSLEDLATLTGWRPGRYYKTGDAA